MAGSNPTGAWISVSYECCVLFTYRPLRRADQSSRGVLPNGHVSLSVIRCNIYSLHPQCFCRKSRTEELNNFNINVMPLNKQFDISIPFINVLWNIKSIWMETNLTPFAFLFHYLILNMFRVFIYPFSGACDLCFELFHGLYCSRTMCVGVTVWFGWGGVVSLCRLKHCFSQHKDTTPHHPSRTKT